MMEDPNPQLQVRIPLELFERLSENCLRVTAALDLDEVLQAVADGIRNITGARYGAVELFDDAGRRTRSATSSVRVPDDETGADPPDETGPGAVRENGVAAGPAEEDGPHGRSQPAGELLEAPILHDGEPLGRVYVVGKSDGGFTRQDEHVLSVFASHAAATITNALMYQAQLRARANLEVMTDISLVGGIVFDAKTGALVSVTDEATRILRDILMPGRTFEQVLQVLTLHRADGRVVSLNDVPLVDILASGEIVRSEEIVISVPDGRSIAVLVNAQPILSEDGEVVSVVAALQTLPAAETRARARAALAGTVSSGLNTPLATIKGSTAIALGAPLSLDPAEAAQLFRVIDDQAGRMRDYINGLVDLTRFEAGLLTFHFGPQPVVEMIADARIGFLRTGGEAIITTTLPEDIPLVMADRERIEEVLRQLFSRLASLSGDLSIISVSVELQETHVAISVANLAGSGPSAPGDRLILELSRMEEAGVHAGVTGGPLDFVLIRGVVEAHGGEFSVESDGPGSGVRFTFTIPVAG